MLNSTHLLTLGILPSLFDQDIDRKNLCNR